VRASRSVGAIPQTSKFQPNQGEIAEVFSLPLTAFANLCLVEEQEVLINDVPRDILVYYIGNRRI
jgi:hypothetical protein